MYVCMGWYVRICKYANTEATYCVYAINVFAEKVIRVIPENDQATFKEEMERKRETGRQKNTETETKGTLFAFSKLQENFIHVI